MKTRAAILRERNQPWSVEEIELDPPKAGEVLVKMVASGMCHSDEHLLTGDLMGASPEPPMIGGHEGSGVILEVGEGVRTARAGRPRRCSVSFRRVGDASAVPWAVEPLRQHGRPRDRLPSSPMARSAPRRRWPRPRSDVPARHVRRAHRRQRVERASRSTRTGRSTGVPARLRRRDRVGLRGRTPPTCSRATTSPSSGSGGSAPTPYRAPRWPVHVWLTAIDPVEFKREKAMKFGATHSYSSMPRRPQT